LLFQPKMGDLRNNISRNPGNRCIKKLDHPVLSAEKRRMHKLFLAVAVAAFGAGSSLSWAADAAPKNLKVLLVTGGCCHDYTSQKSIIADGLAERAYIEVTTVQQGGSTTDSKIALYDNPNWAAGYDLVIHDECFSDVKETNWVARILEPHKKGLPAVALHCAMHSYRTGTDDWFQFLGVTSPYHGASYAHAVFNRDATHPIMQGAGPAWFNPAGELYHIEKIWPTAHPLASAKNQETGKEEVCAWVNQYGNTRVFGTTLGHHNETVSHPAYLDMLTRGALWAMGHLDPAYLKPAKPILVPLNLAKGRKASASTEEKGKSNVAKNAFDGDSGSRWCAENGKFPQWLQVDLGKTQNVAGLSIDWEQKETIYKYRVETSEDGQSWNTTLDRSNNDQPGAVKIELNGSPRFVRVVCLGSNGGWASISELQVFSDQMVAVDSSGRRAELEKSLLREVKAPEGFDLSLFAAPPAVNYPVFVSAGPDGTVYVSSDKNGSLDRAPRRGSILRLRDIDGDGRADETKLFVADVDSPRGLVWDRDRLYVMHPPHLSAFIDHDGDGIADEEKTLVKNIAFTFKDRPADHTSNGLELGIDGWIYMAIGDFGFMEAEGADGRKVQMRGGGVFRVRPDGTELELYSRGTRNILEAALTPLLDAFARDNTNDGDGWDTRLHHFTQLSNSGYPTLFKHFENEIAQPLGIYGGGSGCGSLFLDEPGFPAGYNHALYTSDWGREFVYQHQLTPKGASFTATQSEFLRIPRVTDLDVDASSRLYLTSWKGATFTYVGEDVGFMVQVKPVGYKAAPLPNFATLPEDQLIQVFAGASQKRRQEAQRELLAREITQTTAGKLADFARNGSNPLEGRVAAIFAIKQGLGARAAKELSALAEIAEIREFALRALTDRKSELKGLSHEPFVQALADANPRAQRQAMISLARLDARDAAGKIIPLLSNSDERLAHTALESLAALQAGDAAFQVVDDPNAPTPLRERALLVLQRLHQEDVVNGLIRRLEKEPAAARRIGLFIALARLYNVEGKWKGDSWGTRPETAGPYYQPEPWEGSAKIGAALEKAFASSSADEAVRFAAELNRHRVKLENALELMIDRASKDSALIPALAGQLAKADAIPSSAVSLLAVSANDQTVAPAARAEAIIALAKANSGEATRAILTGLVALNDADGIDRERRQARDAFFNSRGTEQNRELLAKTVAENSSAAPWAEAALLKIASRNQSSSAARTFAQEVLDKEWASSPEARAKLLQAVAISEHRPWSDKVLSAINDSNADVSRAARRAAAALRLDLSKVASKAKEPLVGETSVDEVLNYINGHKGAAKTGEELFVRQGCNACHTVKADEPLRGPFLGTVATTYKRRELGEAVLMPSKSIAQGFVSHRFDLPDDVTVDGFVTQEAADVITIRNVTGQEMKIKASDILKRTKLDKSIMPEGLAANLTLDEFASLLAYLESLSKK
jgi:putative membrane-bound dehydrogenase-like protein